MSRTTGSPVSTRSPQRCYAEAEALAALEAAGFTEAAVEVQPPDPKLSGGGLTPDFISVEVGE